MNKYSLEIQKFNKSNSIPFNGLVRFAFRVKFARLEEIIDSLQEINSFFFFSKPVDGYKFLGIGCTENQVSNDFIRFVSQGTIDSKMLYEANPELMIPEYVPLVLGAEKFPYKKNETLWKDFSESKWFIPQILLYQTPSTSIIIFQYFGNNPPFDLFEQTINLLEHSSTKTHKINNRIYNSRTSTLNDWEKSVKLALKEIETNAIEKVVLARKITLDIKSEFSLPNALTQLQDKYSDCTTFAYKESNSIFFGSSPEKMFSLKDNKLETEALAGSSARGLNIEDDLINESNLLLNPKELCEHKNVFSFLINSLKNFSDEISYSSNPQIKKLSNIQHLQTPITAILKDEIDILELLKALHPTPAVCGLPQKNALELIKDLEYFDRGLYAGIIGWYNAKKRAEFVVSIRSALLKDNTITAFAGCGIVEGSNPVTEFYETELKLKPILSLLENEIINQS